MKIKLKDIEIKKEKDLIKKLKRYDCTIEEALGEIINRQLWRAVNTLEKNKCQKCGKPTGNTLTLYQVTQINRGVKTKKDFGICECEDK